MKIKYFSVRDKGLYYQATSRMSFIFMGCSLLPKVHGGNTEQSRWMLHAVGVTKLRETLSLGIDSFIVGFKQACPNCIE